MEAEDELLQLVPGSRMKYQVNELDTDTTYYFAIKTIDGAGNAAPVSNVVIAATYTPVQDSVTVASLDELKAAIGTAPASGRIITLAGGTYNQTSPINIKGKNNITIQGATTDYNDTVIAGPGINNNSLWINIVVDDSDYITIKNLTIKDSYYHAVQINSGSNYFHADNLKAWDNGEGGFKVTGTVSYDGKPYADYGIIENSLVGYTSGGYRSAVECVDIIAARGWVIRGNYFTNNFKNGGNGISYAVFAKGNSIGTVIENNVFRNNFIAVSFGGGGTGPQYFRNGDSAFEHRGGIISNNVIYGTVDTGIYLNKALDFKIYNNTIMNVDTDQNGNDAIEVRFAGTAGSISNNLMSDVIKIRDGGSYTGSNNITNATNGMFVNVATGDFHLVSGTPAIDAGMRIAEVLTVMDGDPRPYGTAYDIGADEFSPVPAALLIP